DAGPQPGHAEGELRREERVQQRRVGALERPPALELGGAELVRADDGDLHGRHRPSAGPKAVGRRSSGATSACPGGGCVPAAAAVCADWARGWWSRPRKRSRTSVMSTRQPSRKVLRWDSPDRRPLSWLAISAIRSPARTALTQISASISKPV